MVTNGADRLRGTFSKSPLSFDDLAGRGALPSHLRHHVQGRTDGLCLLFHGQKGLGKSLIARLFAKAISCDQPTDARTSCNKCVACQGFEHGNALGYACIDVATENELGVTKKIAEAAMLAGGPSLVRAVIQIDNADQCTQAVFDVLLKTMEDKEAVFLLTATECNLVRPAIRSRTITYRVRPLGRDDTLLEIDKLLADKGIHVDDGVIELLGALSQGVPATIIGICTKISPRARLSLEDIRDVFDLNWPDEIAKSRALRLAPHDLVKDPAVFAPKQGAREGARRLRSLLVQIGIWETSKPNEESGISDPAFFRLDAWTKAALLDDFYLGSIDEMIVHQRLWAQIASKWSIASVS
jgi:DNA polymerase III subunit gamma/tau